MKFTNLKALLLVLLSAAWLSGCTSILSSDSSKTAAKGEQVSSESIPVNPYLNQSVSIPSSVKKEFSKGVGALKSKQWGQAESIFKQLWTEYPTYSGIAVNLGLAYKGQGKLNEAVFYLQKAINTNKNNLNAYNQLAVVYRKQGKFTHAESSYKKALAIWEYHPETHHNLAILYELYMGQWDEALSHYRRYRELVPEPNRKLNGWIKDLERRVKERSKAANANVEGGSGV